jgi:hypothetical protein
MKTSYGRTAVLGRSTKLVLGRGDIDGNGPNGPGSGRAVLQLARIGRWWALTALRI